MNIRDMWEQATSQPNPEPPPAPGLVKKAKNFVKSAMKHMATGMSLVPKSTQAQRLFICESCEFYDKSNPKNPSCKKCGCFLNIKTSWASEKCPIDKWNIIYPGDKGCGCG